MSGWIQKKGFVWKLESKIEGPLELVNSMNFVEKQLVARDRRMSSVNSKALGF